jgi:hypothetical protein
MEIRWPPTISVPLAKQNKNIAKHSPSHVVGKYNKTKINGLDQ